jgi:tetratricopeptide (TPR) repeat protein
LDVCPNAELMPYLQEQLEILEEEKAEINFIVGDYYLKQAIKFQNRGLNGAKFRFLEIVEKYPNYSKMDEVLFLLGETYLLEKDFKKAREYFEKVSDEFPESTFARQSNTKASIAFNEMCLYKKPVYINGEVENQGIIIISDDTTLMQAIDKAGGIRPKVKVKYITIYRKKSGTLADRETIKFKLKELKKKKIEDPILKPCDVIDVEGSSKFSRPQDYEGIDIL